jgi:periplasmic protein TonB
MKLDIFNNDWIDMVFEGRNKSYGAYELRKENSKSSFKALWLGALFFALAMALPVILDKFSGLGGDDEANSKKIVTIKLPPKQKKDELVVPPPPPPPPPQQSQVKFVKPVVAKAEEVVEDPPKIKEIENKKTGAEDIKGNDDAPISIEKPREESKVVEEDPNQLFSQAGIEVQPEYPGGMPNFYKFVGNNYQVPEEEGLSGKVLVSFVVERDGSLTDIKVIRDLGYGTGAEAIRVLKKGPKWAPGEQNGKKVRCTYQLPITIQSPE